MVEFVTKKLNFRHKCLKTFTHGGLTELVKHSEQTNIFVIVHNHKNRLTNFHYVTL